VVINNSSWKSWEGVVGNKAKEVFTQHLQAMQQKDAKVIVSFVIGDIQPASYSYVDKISKETKAGCSTTFLRSCLKTISPLIFKLFIAINLPSIEHPAFVSLLILST
jgi:hypothetical protein